MKYSDHRGEYYCGYHTISDKPIVVKKIFSEARWRVHEERNAK